MRSVLDLTARIVLLAGILHKHSRQYVFALFAACAALLVAAPIVGAAGDGLTRELTRSGVEDVVPPIVSGTPAVGQALSCFKGLWTGGPSLEYAYEWLRDGDTIKGTTGKTYVVQPADQGHELACEITASSTRGNASAKSNTLVVPAASAPPPTGRIELSTSTIVVFAGTARVHIRCVGAPCSGTLELTERVVVKHRPGRRAGSRGQTLKLGRGHFSLAARQRGVLLVRLTKTGKLVLARNHRLSAVLGASVAGGRTVKELVQLSQAHQTR